MTSYATQYSEELRTHNIGELIKNRFLMNKIAGISDTEELYSVFFRDFSCLFITDDGRLEVLDPDATMTMIMNLRPFQDGDFHIVPESHFSSNKH